MTRKKITNPRTGKSYAIRQRTTSAGKKGQIKGLYRAKRQSSAYVKKNFGDVIRKLSKE
ncbi:MAG: hypothetical protein U9M94_04700 [Patescibacteria group bacterium]|nr:hypothetical protein [Patescibacteria group bacterium]